MTLAQTLATLSAAHATEAPAAIAPVVVPSVSFRFWVSKEPQMIDKLVADLYAVKTEGYVEALFTALESAGVQYRTLKSAMLIKVYSGKTRVNVRTIGHPLSRISGESISGWLDRVAMDPAVKAIGIEIASSDLTPAQVKHMHRNLAPSKFNAETTDNLVGMFTFIAPPNLAPEAKQFTRTEHMESVPLPVLRVPAGHVEPAAPTDHLEFVGDAPVVRMTDDDGSYVEYGTQTTTYIDGVLQEEFAVEPMEACAFPVEPQYEVLEEELVVDNSPTIVEIDSLEARTLRELGLLWKSEFGYNVPSKIRHADLCLLIEAKRDSSF